MRWARVAISAVLTFGCEAREPITGTVGIFYGGQVQELQVLELDPLRAPIFGIRVQLPASAAAEEHQVRWEVLRPGPAGRRVTEVGNLRIEPGRTEIEQTLPVDLREAPGLMNVRVLVDGQVVIDRAIDVRKP